MTTQEKLIRRKQSLLELAEYLQNVSQACKINGVSRQHFYDIKKAYEEQGIEGLREKPRQEALPEEPGRARDRDCRDPDGLRVPGLWTDPGRQ